MTRAADTELEKPRLEISATQITTGVVASTASALLGSTLGVAGTLLGAALGAVVYSIAATLYSHSVAAAKHRLLLAKIEHGGHGDGAGAHVVETLPRNDEEVAAGPDAADAGADVDRRVVAEAAVRNPAEPRRPRAPRTPKGPRLPGGSHWRSVLAGSVGSAIAFSVALLLVTGFESAKGAPLSGGTAGGLTVLGGSARTVPDSSTPVTSVSTTTNVTVVHHETSTAFVTSTEQVPGSDGSTGESTVSDEVPETTESTPSAGESAEKPSHQTESGMTAPQTTAPDAPPAEESAAEQSAPAETGAGVHADRGSGVLADRDAASAPAAD